MPDAIEMRAEGFKELGEELIRATKILKAETRVAVFEAAEEIKEAAKELAAEHSTSIPPTIRVEDPGMEAGLPAARVAAGGANVPLATLYELGNVGAKQSVKTFRHPLFGNRNHWYEQPRYRYLGPARTRTRVARGKAMDRAWSKALVDSGLRHRVVDGDMP